MTKTVSIPDSTPPMMSVSIRSPIMTASSEWTPSFFKPVRIINGFGFADEVSFLPVASSIGCTVARQAGITPRSLGLVISPLVPISLAPLLIGSVALIYHFIIIACRFADDYVFRIDIIERNTNFIQSIDQAMG